MASNSRGQVSLSPVVEVAITLVTSFAGLLFMYLTHDLMSKLSIQYITIVVHPCTLRVPTSSRPAASLARLFFLRDFARCFLKALNCLHCIALYDKHVQGIRINLKEIFRNYSKDLKSRVQMSYWAKCYALTIYKIQKNYFC